MNWFKQWIVAIDFLNIQGHWIQEVFYRPSSSFRKLRSGSRPRKNRRICKVFLFHHFHWTFDFLLDSKSSLKSFLLIFLILMALFHTWWDRWNVCSYEIQENIITFWMVFWKSLNVKRNYIFHYIHGISMHPKCLSGNDIEAVCCVCIKFPIWFSFIDMNFIQLKREPPWYRSWIVLENFKAKFNFRRQQDHFIQGSTHRLVCSPLGASWCDILQFY